MSTVFKILVRLQESTGREERYIKSRTLRLQANAAPLRSFDEALEAVERVTKSKPKSAA